MDMKLEVITSVTAQPPGSAQAQHLIVNDVDAAHGEHQKRIGAEDPDWPGSRGVKQSCPI
jgi:hypothetical protein